MMSAHLHLARLANEMTVVVVKLALYSTTSPSVGKTMPFFFRKIVCVLEEYVIRYTYEK